MFFFPAWLHGLVCLFQLGYDIGRKADETNSDNSGEMGTRDSGQGGSDVDLNSISELPVLDIPGVWFFLALSCLISHCFIYTG